VWLCWVASVAATVLLAFLFGLPILRLRGEYFMVASLGLGEIVRIVIQNLEVTGGPNGLSGIDRPQLFGLTIRPPLGFYYLLLAFIAVSVLVLMRLDRSTLGRSWFALREDDRAAEAVGVPSYRSKLSVFALGAVWAGLAGGVFASRMTAVSPDSFTLWDSIVMLGMVLVGGMGSLPGVALGAAVMMGLPELFRGLAQWRLVLFGTAIVVLLRFRPGGIWPPKQWLLPLHLSRDEQANAVWRVG
ncbi:MAG: branched-chain amino acid ABC transporter permease, partial [Clostridia bacterium]|nr:branched-chain amino acid ABC transporter permease [Clostridia bacterium]